MPLKNTWNEIIRNLGSVISKSEIDTWFVNTECSKIDENSAVIEVPNKFIAVWLHDNYYDIIKNYLKKITKKNLNLQFNYNKNNNSIISENINQNKLSLDNQNNISSNNLNKLMKFNNFVTGDCNLFAYSSAVSISENPGGYYSPFYIFSKHGIGKTHLLNSIGNKLNINQFNISYINSKNFILDYNFFSKNKDFDSFKERNINLDVLLFDDIQ
jgi:chromosomal replication initiator protein